MPDIFFSYSHSDRERVKTVHDVLAARGFDVFWDVSVPPGGDWDTLIRTHLRSAKCAIVFWSKTSINSVNVRHEATIAREHDKLIPALLDPLTTDEFPMGLYMVQAANLTGWTGDEQHSEWLKLQNQIEGKLTPPWVTRQLDKLRAELFAETVRREGAESWDRTLRERIAAEAKAQLDLRRERDEARETITTLQQTIGELKTAHDTAAAERARIETRAADSEAKLKLAEARIGKLEQDVLEARKDAAAAETGPPSGMPWHLPDNRVTAPQPPPNRVAATSMPPQPPPNRVAATSMPPQPPPNRVAAASVPPQPPPGLVSAALTASDPGKTGLRGVTGILLKAVRAIAGLVFAAGVAAYAQQLYRSPPTTLFFFFATAALFFFIWRRRQRAR
jgi:hypothetical protein